MQEILINDSENLLIKAASDAKIAFTYAIEAKSITEERKIKLQALAKPEDTIKSVKKEKKCSVLTINFFEYLRLLRDSCYSIES